MSLKQFFTLIIMSIFQNGRIDYEKTLFYCPRIICKDGFNISLQIHNGNYSISENGYRKLGVDWQEVEFGFPSMNDKNLHKYSEMYDSCPWDEEEEEKIPFNKEDFTVVGTVGIVPTDVMQKVLDSHGGIDWNATLSFDVANKFIKKI